MTPSNVSAEERVERQQQQFFIMEKMFFIMVREAGEASPVAVNFAHDFTVGMDLAKDFQKKLPTSEVTLLKVRCEPVAEYQVRI